MVLEATSGGLDRLTAQMERRMQIVELLDCYGPLLKEKQRDLLDLYHNQDLSLAELAQEQDVSRQAVHEAIKRGEIALYDFEARLGFLRRMRSWQELTEELRDWPLEEGELRSLRSMWLKRAETLL